MDQVKFQEEVLRLFDKYLKSTEADNMEELYRQVGKREPVDFYSSSIPKMLIEAQRKVLDGSS